MALKRTTKILDEFGRPITVDVPRPSSRYDLTGTDNENRKWWARADVLSARAANSPEVRRKLRMRSRLERDNDPYYGGMIRTVVGDLYGTGPRLQAQSDSDLINTRVEKKFSEWAEVTDLLGTLLTAGEGKICDGEGPMLIRTDDDVEGHPPLSIQGIETEQIATPATAIVKDQRRHVDGIELDARGKPIAYHILRDHPGDSFADGEFERVPAENVLQNYRRFRAGQYRGIPECSASVPVGAQRRRWSQATLVAAELAADFAVLITSKLPDGYTDDDLPAEFESVTISRGMITTLPAGGDAKQMKSEHPSAEFSSFKHELLKEVGRPIGAPYSITGLDGSEHNYSSLRYEREIYHAALRVERELCRLNVLDRIFRAWYALARLMPGYLANSSDDLPESIPFGWYWTGFAAIDPVKEAVADTERLANGTTTLQEILSGYGQDWQVFITQRAREMRKFIELGLPLPKWMDPKADDSATQSPKEDDANAKALRLALLTEAS